jgi:hypothetical protein
MKSFPGHAAFGATIHLNHSSKPLGPHHKLRDILSSPATISTRLLTTPGRSPNNLDGLLSPHHLTIVARPSTVAMAEL